MSERKFEVENPNATEQEDYSEIIKKHCTEPATEEAILGAVGYYADTSIWSV